VIILWYSRNFNLKRQCSGSAIIMPKTVMLLVSDITVMLLVSDIHVQVGMCWLRDETLRKHWVVLIRNDNLRVTLNRTAVCGLHFLGQTTWFSFLFIFNWVWGGRRTYDEKTPTIINYYLEHQNGWGRIQSYNKMVTDECSAFMNDHRYNFALTPKKLCYTQNDLIGWRLIW